MTFLQHLLNALPVQAYLSKPPSRNLIFTLWKLSCPPNGKALLRRHKALSTQWMDVVKISNFCVYVKNRGAQLEKRRWTIHTRTSDTHGAGRVMRNKRRRMLRLAMRWKIKIFCFSLHVHQGRLEFNPTKACLNHIPFHPKIEVYVIMEWTITFGENLKGHLDWGKQGRRKTYFSQPSHNALIY